MTQETIKELATYLRGRIFSATFKTKEKAARVGAFKLRGWDDRHIYLTDINGGPRTFLLSNLRRLKCGEFLFTWKPTSK